MVNTLSLDVREVVHDLNQITECGQIKGQIREVHVQGLHAVDADMEKHLKTMKDAMSSMKAVSFMEDKVTALSIAKNSVDEAKDAVSEAKKFMKAMQGGVKVGTSSCPGS